MNRKANMFNTKLEIRKNSTFIEITGNTEVTADYFSLILKSDKMGSNLMYVWDNEKMPDFWYNYSNIYATFSQNGKRVCGVELEKNTSNIAELSKFSIFAPINVVVTGMALEQVEETLYEGSFTIKLCNSSTDSSSVEKEDIREFISAGNSGNPASEKKEKYEYTERDLFSKVGMQVGSDSIEIYSEIKDNVPSLTFEISRITMDYVPKICNVFISINDGYEQEISGASEYIFRVPLDEIKNVKDGENTMSIDFWNAKGESILETRKVFSFIKHDDKIEFLYK